MKNIKSLLALAVLFAVVFCQAEAVQIREIGAIDKRPGEVFYGLETSSIISRLDNKIVFYNHRNQPVYELTIEKDQDIVVAENGLFYAVIDYLNDDSAATASFTIYTNRRKPVWGGLSEFKGDFYLSNNGDYMVQVIGDPGYYTAEIALFHMEKPFVRYKVEGFSDILFSDDGRRFIVDAGAKGLFLFDNDGSLVKKIDNRRYYSFGKEFNNWGTYQNGILEIYHDSDLAWTYDFKKPKIYGLDLCIDINRAAIAIQKQLVMFDLDSDTILWKMPADIAHSGFISLDISSDCKFIAAGVDVNLGTLHEKEDRHVQGFLFLFDTEGLTMERMEFKYKTYKDGTPKVRFQGNTGLITVETAEKIHIIEIY